MTHLRVGLAFLACALTASSLAVAATSWNEVTEVRLAVSGDIGSEPMEYRIEVFSGGDARISLVDESVPPAHWPAIVLVGGQVMLVQNLELEHGYEIDALDRPALMLQLVLTLLEHGVNGGPDSVPRDGVDVEHAEPNEPIQISTTSAGGEFPAPWRLSGAVRRDSENRIAYELDLSYAAGAERAKIRITGSWETKEPRPELDQEMELSGWTSYTIGPIERQASGSTVLDFGAQPRRFESQNIGELRQEVSKQD